MIRTVVAWWHSPNLTATVARFVIRLLLLLAALWVGFVVLVVLASSEGLG